MNVRIPPEFECFARELVEAGAVASEEKAVSIVLQDYLDHLEQLRSFVDSALAELGRGDSLDGPAFVARLLAETKSRPHAAE